MSVALVQEEEGVQKPVYYVSKSLLDAETRYQRMEKVVLAFFVIQGSRIISSNLFKCYVDGTSFEKYHG